MNEEEIIARVLTLHPQAVIDIAGEDCSFELYVVSEAFTGVSILKRQQPILALFKEEISNGSLHALTIKAKTPAELSSQGGLIQIQPLA
ncbi:MAG: BolA/IbaG family iron-sulfur metabolism protein [Candidatus Thiodiazotropha taylori]|nr:BolA/IbaG family iron-sulfur metabolism protein [Candidatus Thiodiazotropha taylori]MCG7935923.1 BolA/IbaG family iron-sulfur metabolism protein [Candidatus Thiodiazotropha taylori]MCG7972749.1 BolA/IbaG family iron-sulfur metabolism protein [Candidatus Thiodiazotropha taylori]MCG8083186.1 BolA/IbaG family iron-sulfur metabolism protein [Candidatus Thiodiazotropha taylori]